MSKAPRTEQSADGEVLDRRVCQLTGCGGPALGVCINNLSFDECPDVVELAPFAFPDDAGGKQRTDADFLIVQGGHAFDATACDALLRQRGGIVVGLVAEPDVGKTTLIGTMYELLVRRRMAKFRFAGSDTLRGHEERCHLARTASNGAKADTARTPTIARLSFTHLRIAEGKVITDVVFSDRSGEHFQRVVDRPNEIATFQELRRADVTLLLVDLTELLNAPHVQTAQTRKWFIAMARNGLLDGKTVWLIGTKADLVLRTPDSTAAAEALDHLAKDLSRRSPATSVVPRMIACRPQKGSTQVGEGLEDLLSEILGPKELRNSAPAEVWPDRPTQLDLLMRGYRSKST